MLTKFRNLKEDREQGFTLVELLIVIGIIGILAAIAIPAFMNMRKAARDATVETDVRNSINAVNEWRVKPGNVSKEVPFEIHRDENVGGTTAFIAAPMTLLASVSDTNDNQIDMMVSPGNTVIIGPNTGNPGHHCAWGINKAGDKSATSPGIVFDSELGGLNRMGWCMTNVPAVLLAELDKTNPDPDAPQPERWSSTVETAFQTPSDGEIYKIGGPLTVEENGGTAITVISEQLTTEYTGSGTVDVELTGDNGSRGTTPLTITNGQVSVGGTIDSFSTTNLTSIKVETKGTFVEAPAGEVTLNLDHEFAYGSWSGQGMFSLAGDVYLDNDNGNIKVVSHSLRTDLHGMEGNLRLHIATMDSMNYTLSGVLSNGKIGPLTVEGEQPWAYAEGGFDPVNSGITFDPISGMEDVFRASFPEAAKGAWNVNDFESIFVYGGEIYTVSGDLRMVYNNRYADLETVEATTDLPADANGWIQMTVQADNGQNGTVKLLVENGEIVGFDDMPTHEQLKWDLKVSWAVNSAEHAIYSTPESMSVSGSKWVNN